MRTLSTPTDNAVDDPITRPIFFIELGFASTVRLSSRETYLWNGYTWVAASVDVALSDRPTLQIYNQDTLLGQTVLTDGTAGRTVNVWQGYGDPGASDPELMFSGEMADATIAETVIIKCKRRPPHRTPRLFANPPTFNHLPKAGTRIETPKQTVILE